MSCLSCGEDFCCTLMLQRPMVDGVRTGDFPVVFFHATDAADAEDKAIEYGKNFDNGVCVLRTRLARGGVLRVSQVAPAQMHRDADVAVVRVRGEQLTPKLMDQIIASARVAVPGCIVALVGEWPVASRAFTEHRPTAARAVFKARTLAETVWCVDLDAIERRQDRVTRALTKLPGQGS